MAERLIMELVARLPLDSSIRVPKPAPPMSAA
jgi:hypothetical protein